MYKIQRKLLSQNFLHNRELIKKLVRYSSLGKNDIVVEIGPGTGIITKELAHVAMNVIAVEIDNELASNLRTQFHNFDNVTICQNDIRQFTLPEVPYKVFANIPFSITADIIYKLLYYSHPPIDAYIILQEEAAKKFSGTPHETQFSVLAKPWFDFQVIWHFKKSDFIPMPSVDCVLLKITKREQTLITPEDEDTYKSFVKYAFNSWKKDLKVGLKRIFTYKQWKRLAKENHFPIHAKPTDLNLEQWLAIFKFFSKPS